MMYNIILPLISRDAGAAIMVGLASGLILLAWGFFKEIPERKIRKSFLKNEMEKEKEWHSKQIQKQQFEDRKNNLINLKDKGILSSSEYEEKLQKIEDSEVGSLITESDEYRQLQSLKEDGILTEKEFEEKLELLKKNYNHFSQESSEHQEGKITSLNSQLLSFKDFQKSKEIYYKALSNDNSKIIEGLRKHFEEIFKIKAENDTKKFIEEVLSQLEDEQNIKIVSAFKDDIALVMDSQINFGYINSDYDFIVNPKFQFAEEFCEGLALVRLNDKFGYIDTKGNIAISLVYDDASSFKNGIANVRIGKEKIKIDKNGFKRNI